MQRFPKDGIVRKLRIVERVDEAVDKPVAEVTHVAVAGMHPENARLVTARLRVGRRPAQHLGPVRGETLDVLGMLVVVGERMIELWIRQTARVMSSRESEEGFFPAGELEQRGAHGRSISHDRRGDAVLLDSRLGAPPRHDDVSAAIHVGRGDDPFAVAPPQRLPDLGNVLAVGELPRTVGVAHRDER
jgi:hypothetical protein